MKKQYLHLLFLLIIAQSFSAQNTGAFVPVFTRSLEREQNRDYPGAIKVLGELKDTTSYEVLLRLGWLNYKAGYKKKSLQYYQKAINAMPKALEPRIGYGFPAYELENYSDLIEQDQKILEIDPNNRRVSTNLALIYNYDKQYKKSLPLFEKMVALYPFDYENNLNLAWTYLQLGMKAEAEKYFHITLLYSPTDATAIEGLQLAGKPFSNNDPLITAFAKSYELALNSDVKGAITALKEVYDKSSYFINLRLGWLSHLSGSELESVTYYQIACALMPKAVEPKLGLAIPLEALGNKNELKLQYDAVLALDPLNTYVHYKLGVMYYQKKEYDAAFVHIEKVVNLYPFDYDGVLMFAWTNYQLGKTEESHLWFYRTLCLAPSDVSAKQGLSLKPVEEQKQLDHKQIIKPR